MFLALLLLFCACNATIFGTNDYNDRYNPYKKRLNQITPPAEHRSPEILSEEALEEFELQHEPDNTPHTPLAAICLETHSYGTHFLQHCMNNAVLHKQKDALALFCSLLELLANLADADIGIIRLDSYINNIISIAHALKAASISDSSIDLTHFPLITSFSEPSVDESGITLAMHHALRERSTGLPLITQLLSELQTYAGYKLHAILNSFKNDTKQLLSLAQQTNASISGMNPQPSEVERQSMGYLGWLCRHAATTCLDLADTVPSSSLLAHSGSLLNQVQQMLSTMALTYRNLSITPPRTQDQNSLATLYAQMTEQLKDISPRRGQVSLLHQVHSLSSFQEKQSFIAAIFTSPQESNAFLQEFFPTLTDSLDYNLIQFCTTLTMEVVNTFAKRYWIGEQ